MKRMSKAELEQSRHNLAEARASLACEGLHLTPEQEERFRAFEIERLPHEERRWRIIEAHKQRTELDAAE